MKFPLTLALAALVGASPALADPPSHAPAHGYYKKHQDDDHKKPKKSKHYQGKSGAVYVSDYGISSGRCNRDEIGAVIGGVTGAVIGGQVADRDNRVVGMVVGGVLGAVLGHAIGDSMDDRDRACMGHALELGRPGVPVEWRNAGRTYQFTPRGDARDGCRNATMVVDGRKPQNVLACPSGHGEWRFRRS
jgi:surface antigen